MVYIAPRAVPTSAWAWGCDLFSGYLPTAPIWKSLVNALSTA